MSLEFDNDELTLDEVPYISEEISNAETGVKIVKNSPVFNGYYPYIEFTANDFHIDFTINDGKIQEYSYADETLGTFIHFVPSYEFTVTNDLGDLKIVTRLDMDIHDGYDIIDLDNNPCVCEDMLNLIYDYMKENMLNKEYFEPDDIVEDTFILDNYLKSNLKGVYDKLIDVKQKENERVDIDINNIRNIILSQDFNIHFKDLAILKERAVNDKLMSNNHDVNINYVNVFTGRSEQEHLILSLNNKNKIDVKLCKSLDGDDSYRLYLEKDYVYMTYSNEEKQEFYNIKEDKEVVTYGFDFSNSYDDRISDLKDFHYVSLNVVNTVCSETIKEVLKSNIDKNMTNVFNIIKNGNEKEKNINERELSL